MVINKDTTMINDNNSRKKVMNINMEEMKIREYRKINCHQRRGRKYFQIVNLLSMEKMMMKHFLPTQHHFTHHHQHIPRIHIRCRRRATFNVHQRWTEDLRVPVSADKSQATMQDLTNDDFEMPEHVRLCNYKSDCNVQTNRSTMNRTCIMCGQMRPYKKAGIWIPH